MAGTELKRRIGLFALTLYGLGTTIGAGIYALVGELAAISGYLSPLAFLLASIMASMTALSFAELSSRFPKAAGAALYIQNGFSSISLARVVGLIVALAGMVSSAALINAFYNHLNEFISLPRLFSLIGLVMLLAGIAAWGIAESVFIAALITVIEVSGLLWVITVCWPALDALPQMSSKLLPDLANALHYYVIFSGAVLSFYAYIGFEDMVDVAEEVKEVRRTLPLAIIFTLLVTTVLYCLVMLIAVLAVEPKTLASQKVPLAFLLEQFGDNNTWLIRLIGLVAILNGALIQIIMASRVLYGLSSRRQLPAFLSQVNARFGTPVNATLIVMLIIIALAIVGSLSSLAKATSLIMLGIFTLVNVALLKIKLAEVTEPDGIHFPIWVPAIAAVITGFFVITSLIQMFF